MKKTKKLNIFTLAVIACAMALTSTAHAQSYDDGYDDNATQTEGQDSYTVWCDQVMQNLMQAQSDGWRLYHNQRYTQAKQFVVGKLQAAIASLHVPGTAYQPATYREIQRTLSLIGALEATASNSTAALKAKTIAYVALNRISFISFVKETVDVTYNIPCRHRRQCDAQDDAYEAALAQVAAEQISSAQDYSSKVMPSGLVVPLNDTPFYFTIMAKSARWAAQDLSMSNFSKQFSCPIIKLRRLGSDAYAKQAMFGDVSSVQQIHEKVEHIEGDLAESGYGCGREY